MKKYYPEIRALLITLALIGGYHFLILDTPNQQENLSQPFLKLAYLDFNKVMNNYFNQTVSSYQNPKAHEKEIDLKVHTFGVKLTVFADYKNKADGYIFVNPAAIDAISRDKIPDLSLEFLKDYKDQPEQKQLLKKEGK